MNFEKNIVIFFNRFQSKQIDLASEFISNIKVLFIIWIIIAAFFIIQDFQFGIDLLIKLALVFIIHCIISEGIIKYGIKKIFLLERKRPYIAYPNEIRRIGNNYSDAASSFPSNHMAGVTGGFVILFYAFPFIWPVLLVFELILAISRMYNGMHYPSDILAGIFLGLAYGYAVLSFLSPLTELLLKIILS